MTGSDAVVVERWTTAAVVVAVSLALVVAGLAYGVEDLVWDPSHQSYAYVERPHATAVAWAAAAAAVVGVVWAVRQLGRAAPSRP